MATGKSKPKAAKSSNSSVKPSVKKTAPSGTRKKSTPKKGGANKGLLTKAKEAVTDLVFTAGDAAIVAVAEKVAASGAKATKAAAVKSKTGKSAAKSGSSKAKKSSAKTPSKKT